MGTLTKRATVYFDPAIHRVLKMKALETEHSISYEDLLKKLKADGKI